MVKKRLFLFISALTLFLGLNAQTNQFEGLGQYSKFGIVIGGSLYDKAKIEREYGELSFKNKPIPSYSFGIEYDLFPKNRWSVITGLNASLEPIYNVEYTIKAEDISGMTEDLTDGASQYSTMSFSAPILITFKEKLSEKIYLEFRLGIKALYYLDGFAEHSVSFVDEVALTSTSVFGLRMETTNMNNLYGSFVFGGGINFITKWSLIKLNLVYNYNFQNTMEGEYLFDNLIVSKRTYGKYYLSGNYIGLNAVFHFNKNIFKRKYKKE